MLTSTTRDRLTSVPIMMIAEIEDPTNMGNSTNTTTTTVIMTTRVTVVMTMTKITRVDIRATTVEVAVEASLSRRILVRLSVSSAIRWGIMQMNAQKINLKDPTSPTLFKRDK